MAQSYYPPVFDVTTLNGTNGFAIPGIQANSQFGAETQFIGDINNDGFEDIAIGVQMTDVNGVDSAGTAYIIFGSSTGFPASFDITSLDGTNGFIVEGLVQYEGIGLSVQGVGDINGDSIDDLIVGASRYGGGLLVIYGKPTNVAFNATINRNDIDGNNGFIIITTGVPEQMEQIASLGDVNGDHINDFILGKSVGGKAWIIFGQSTNFPLNIDSTWLDGVKGFQTSNFPSSRASFKVGGAGDINNDGINDILIGSWNDPFNINEQISYALFGKSTPFDLVVDLPSLNGTDGFSIDNQGNGFLTFVGAIGDVNGDGIDDCFSENDIIFGSSSAFPSSLLQSNLNGTNGFLLNNYVLCAAPTGDLNQDGIDDFIIAATDDYVVFGTTGGFSATFDPTTLDGTNGFKIPTTNTNIARPIDGGKDFNGDGISDFIFSNRSFGGTGQVYVVFGGDHYAMPLTASYPQAINETSTGFTLLVNSPEIGTIHYAIYPGNYSTTVTHDAILNGTGAITQGSFAINVANTDVSEIISSLTASTTYDVYLFLEDSAGNQGDIYPLGNITSLAAPCPYTVPCAERDALIALYNATDGPNWDTNTNWLTSNPVDTWHGVTVANGHVTGIEFAFSGNNLNGTLPTELGDLNFLEKFIMPRNPNLTGSIVSELFTNTTLTEIDLGNNGLTGSIPSNISNLTALQSLQLNNNALSGSIPAGMYSLTNLQVLNIYGNNISGPISTAIQNLTQLTSLLIGSNPIGGSIPTEIGLLTNLTNLNIYNANLTGTIPTEIGNLINLKAIQLSRNGLSGSIPASMGNLNQIVSFYLGNNDLTGSIPSSLGNLTNVKLFLLGDNQLTGSIPPELGLLTKAESFYLYNNNLSGNIPTELGGLTSVTQLYLSNNQLTGTIPASLATLPNVEDIFFFKNNLSGTLPDFTQAPSLNYRILLDNNAFQFGDFENQWVAYQSQLSTFDDSPQAYVNTEETVSANIGDNITLTTTVSGSQNNYQWYKNNTLITGATSADLILNPIQLSDAGDYHCIITSNIVTDLTLRRNFIHLVVTAADTEAPAITCPSDQELACNATTIPDYTALVTVTDNQDPNPTITQSPVAGTTFTDGMTITITATDASSNSDNCTFTVNTAADTDKPILTCLTSESLFVNSTLPNYYLKLGASDNCTSLFDLTYTQTPAQGTVFTADTNVTVTVTDSSGNTESCSFLVTVKPAISPTDCNTTSISTNDLDGSNGFQIDGNKIKGELGYDVRGAGDINGDGIEDFLVGSPNKAYKFSSPHGQEQGNFPGDVFVIFGKGNNFSPNLDTSLLDGTNGFKIANDIPGGPFQFSGYQVSTAGDINNDGIDDLMFSDPFRHDSFGQELGTTYVVFGKTSGFPAVFNVSDIDGTNGFVFIGADNYDQSALSLDSAGDINNDGINDIIIGARAARPTNKFGKCYIIYGSSTSFPALIKGSDLNGTNGFIIKGETDGDGIGNWVEGLGDVNGDGIDDVGFSGGNTNKTFVLFGKTGGFSNIVDASSINGTTGFYVDLSSFSSNSGYNRMITRVGDVNNDGINDILFGNRKLVFGKNTGFSVPEDITSLDGTNGVELTGSTYNTSSAGGDFNNDGIDDLIVGRLGSIAIVYGKNTPWSATLNPFSLPSSEAFVINRSDLRDYPVSDLEDINGDGITDVIIGKKETLYYDSSSSLYPGYAHVIYGFSVSDTEPPVITTCPSDQVLASGNVLPDYTSLATATDNCDATPVISQNPIAGSAYTSGMTITLIATDKKGNTSNNCTFIVSDNTDTQAPTITCPSDQELACNTASIPDYTALVTVTDNQDPNPTITQAPVTGTAFTEGMTITMTATDASGNNNSCTFTVNTAADTEAPVVICNSAQNLPIGSTIQDYTSFVTVTDNCDINSSLTIVQSPVPGTAFTNGMTVEMTVTDSSGNEGKCSFTLNLIPDTEAPTITCPSDQELACNITSIPDYTTLVTVTDNQDPNPTITQNPVAGTAFTDGMTITMRATDASGNNNECTFVLNNQLISVDAGLDEEIIEGQEVQLNANAVGTGTYIWSPSIGLNDTNISNPIANPIETTTYIVTFTNINGCTAEDDITVYVEPQQSDKTKYGFSPDNDGINEFWKIEGIEKYPKNKVSIYNRWGDLVFETEGYNNTSRVFRGIANRKRNMGANELPEGTYFFDIKIDGAHTIKKLKGYIILKR